MPGRQPSLCCGRGENCLHLPGPALCHGQYDLRKPIMVMSCGGRRLHVRLKLCRPASLTRKHHDFEDDVKGDAACAVLSALSQCCEAATATRQPSRDRPAISSQMASFLQCCSRISGWLQAGVKDRSAEDIAEVLGYLLRVIPAVAAAMRQKELLRSQVRFCHDAHLFSASLVQRLGWHNKAAWHGEG